jgi:peptidoglycan/LPS O-acetylase OafA/YrhL
MTDTAVREPPSSSRRVLRHRRRPALDGVRALAVAAVVAYHLDALRGGFVGVDVFFVLSGYLITALLIRERESSDAISLRSFWGRRIRRLWPLAWSVLGVVAVAGLAGVWDADQQRRLPSQTAASLLNVANWWQLAHGGYAEQFVAPSPLRHFWSLAVEEQFYLVWPVLLAVLLALAVRRGRWVLWAGIASLAAASIVVAWTSTPEDAYLRTDSRAVALLIGAALAAAWRAHPLAGPEGTHARRAIAAWGALGTGVLVWVALTASPNDEWLHHGGFTLIAVAACGVVAAAVTVPSVRRGLGAGSLVWLGERSYAVYLIHWPLVVALGVTMPALLRAAIVVVASLVLAALVHRWLERPVIAGALPSLRLAAVGVLVLAVMGVSLAAAAPSGPTPEERVGATLHRVADPESTGARATTTTCVPVTVAPPVFGDDRTLDRSTFNAVADPTAAACAGQLRVLVLGDSTARGISNGLNSLEDPRIQVFDRSTLGCSYGPERCPDWRTTWPAAVHEVQPDVVLIYTTVLIDLQGVEDASFLTPAADRQRVDAFEEAVRLTSATGAKVLLVVPARPTGRYYCNGPEQETTCDRARTAAWKSSIETAALATGAGVVDAGAWIDARNRPSDRPDGLHLSGEALREHATWLVPQLLSAGGRSG